ncbi:hypothetical protein R3P38DRAFT_3249499 [Favolaschia claudopus]|uniref:F-box domain-containing protein n=1 Tax=Favolaschia claudopus TaxID=2862362 RepID=A0AAW0EEC2_9AGAR
MPSNGLLSRRSFFAAAQIHMQILSEICCHWAAVDFDAPWKATLVCHLWRAAVLSSPKAWSIVNVCFPPAYEKKPPKQKNLPWGTDSGSEDDCIEEDSDAPPKPRPWALWLARARGSDLVVRIFCGICPRVDLIYSAIRLLSSHAGKIKVLEVDSNSVVMTMAQVFSMFDCATLALKSLSLSINLRPFQRLLKMREDSGVVDGFWNFLTKSPHLRSLTLSGCVLGSEGASFRGRQNQLGLKTLIMENPHRFRLHPVLETIRPFICLEILILDISVVDRDTNSPTLILPTLKTFVGHDEHILGSLTLPKLENLTFHTESSTDDLVTVLAELFERGTNLQNLTLAHALLSNSSSRRIFQHIPSLTALELQYSAIALQSLVATAPSDRLLCPRLQTLRLISSLSSDGANLLDIIKARRKSASARPITTLVLSECKLLSSHEVDKMRNAGGSGLIVKYTEYDT